MIITFCGHSDYIEKDKDKECVLALLNKIANGEDVEFFLGGYGRFDSFAYSCAKAYKNHAKGSKLIFVTPYITHEYQKSQLEYKETIYDNIIYPPIEKAPLRFAISYRNKYMVEQADCIIAYITRQMGGAYNTYKHAIRKNKKVFNIAENNCWRI